MLNTKPVRATFAGHDKRRHATFYGSSLEPAEVGVPVWIEQRQGWVRFYAQDTDEKVTSIPSGSKYWATP
jgi:hypothetical protein